MMNTPSSRQEASKLFEHFSKSRNGGENISIEWKNLSYSILVKDAAQSTLISPVYKKKRILRPMDGKVSSGELLAIMGPTGFSFFLQRLLEVTKLI